MCAGTRYTSSPHIAWAVWSTFVTKAVNEPTGGSSWHLSAMQRRWPVASRAYLVEPAYPRADTRLTEAMRLLRSARYGRIVGGYREFRDDSYLAVSF